MFALRAREHLVLARVRVAGEVSDIGDIHYAFDVVARETQIFFQHILHDIGAEVADVGEVIDGGTAGVHIHSVALVGDEFLLGLSERVV